MDVHNAFGLQEESLNSNDNKNKGKMMIPGMLNVALPLAEPAGPPVLSPSHRVFNGGDESDAGSALFQD